MSDAKTPAPEPSDKLETKAPAPAVDPTPEAKAAEAPSGDKAAINTGDKTETPPSPEPAPAREDWRDKRIATLTARLREAEAKAKTPVPYKAPAPAADPEAFNNAVRAEAARLAAAREFTNACNSTAETGRREWTDFDDKVRNLQRLVNAQDPASLDNFNQFLQAAIDTGEGHKIIYELGADLNEADRVLQLDPIKRAVELTKKVAGLAPTVSRTPKPITPVVQRGAAAVPGDPSDPDRAGNMSTAEWMRERNKQVDAAWERAQKGG